MKSIKRPASKLLLKLVLLLLVACFVPTAAPAADSAKMAEINKLLELTRIAQYSLEGLAGMMALSIPAEFKPENEAEPGYELRLGRALAQVIWQDLGADLMSRLAGIYDRVFSRREIQALIEFYSSPAGQKIIEATPQLTAQLQKASVELATDWASKYEGEKGAEQLKARLTAQLEKGKKP